MDNFLYNNIQIQHEPITLPHRAKYILSDTTCKIFESFDIMVECHRSDQFRTGNKHQMTIAPNRFNAW